MFRHVRALTLGLLVLASPRAAAALPADSLAAARAAYLATEYEEALRMLGTPADGPPSDEADMYRALCLLALNRPDDVEQVLGSLALRSPSFRMSADVPPRLVSMFDDVRRRTLQRAIRSAYQEAKASFDDRRYTDASSRFAALLDLIANSGLSGTGGSAMEDLSQLARTLKERADTEAAKAAAIAAAEARTVAARAAAAEDASIRRAILQYAQAYSALDADAVVRVFPAEDATALVSAFTALKSQEIDTRNLAVALGASRDEAVVTLTWAVAAVPKIGAPVRAQHKATLRMSRTRSGEWTIVERR